MKIYRYKLYTNARRGGLNKTITRFGEVRNYAVKMMELYLKHTGGDVKSQIEQKRSQGVEMKAADNSIEVTGKVVKVLPGSMYRVKIENGIEILSHLSGKMRKFNIRISLGDEVKVEMSPYDLTKGRIIYRNKA